MWKKDFLFSIVYILKQQLSILKDLLLDLLTQNISLSIKTKKKYINIHLFIQVLKKAATLNIKKLKARILFHVCFSYFRNAL